MHAISCAHAGLTSAVIFVLALFLSGCGSNAALRSGTTGKTVSYTPGAPDFDMESAATWRSGKSGVDLYLRIPYASLIFLRRGDFYSAMFEFNVRVTDRGDDRVVFEDFWMDSVRIADPLIVRRTQSALARRSLMLSPGEFIIEVVLQDRNTDVRAFRQQQITVRGYHPDCVMLSRIMVERKVKSVFEPWLQMHLPGDPDSLRTVVTLYNPGAATRPIMNTSLLRLVSDTSAAVPPFMYSPFQGTLKYRGVDYDKRDTIQTMQYGSASAGADTTLNCTLPILQSGVYLFTAQVSAGNCPEVEGFIRERRYLSVMGRGFPRPTMLDQLVEAMAYVARGSELKRIQSAESVGERRRRFDSLWIAMAGGQQAAANAIKQYYTRAEEANLLFTTHKEGWKTDRGMVYMILGPPESIEAQFQREIWRYPSGYRYDFVKTQAGREDVPFDNYILQRDSYYEISWTREVDRWRRGKSF